MYRTILVALDGSRNAEKALPLVEPVLRDTGARALLVQVLPAGEPAPLAAAESYLASVAKRLARKKIRAEAEVVRGDAAVAIIRAAERRKADLVAFTSHGQGGLAQWVFGSVAQKILRGCPRPLFVVRALEEARPRVQRVVVPLDGSVGSEAVLPHAIVLARAYGATAELLHVCAAEGIEAQDSKLRGWIDRERRRMEARFREIARAHPDVAVAPCVEQGDAALTILRRAGRSPGSVVAMGNHGRTGLSRWVYGSVSEKVLQASRSPVLIARHTPS